MSEIFIFVLRDRHADIRLSVHRSRAGADAEVDKVKAMYAEHRSTKWVKADVGAPDWVHYERDEHDDGPSMYIERSTLQP